MGEKERKRMGLGRCDKTLTLRTVACTDGNVSLLFEVLLASTPAYTTLGHVHSRGR